jgi:hypothetical protein
VIEPRLYRAAFVPALLAAVLAMFSLGSRPRPLAQGLAADVLFDGQLAQQSATRIAAENPDRRPGSEGNRAVAAQVAETFEQRGFQVERTRFTHAGRELENVVGVRAGGSRRQLVVVAARDSQVEPDAPGSASDTAALLELARVFEGRPSSKTLVLASVDGSTLGEVGTMRLAESLPEPELVDGVVVMSDLGARPRRGSPLQAWSNDSLRANIGQQRTAADSIRRELEIEVGGAGALGQLARMSFPIGIGPQGVLLERGYDAVRISGSGELPPEGPGPVEEIDEDRLGGLGRATLRTVTAIDQGRRAEHGPDSYVIAGSQVVPGWVLALLAVALLLPVLATSIDSFARARRRQVPVLPWLRWLGAWVLPFVAALAGAELLALFGATPEPPPAPVAPQDMPFDGPAAAVLGGVAAIWALALLLARRLLVRPDPALADRSDRGAGVLLALVAAWAGFVLWFVNPFAGLMFVLPAHLWLLAVLVEAPVPRRTMVALGALPALFVSLYYLFALALSPWEAAWYLLLLVTGHQVGLITALLACVLLGCFLGALEIAWARREEPDEEPAEPAQRVYGPGHHAGPGALGGTGSALRR